MCQFGWNHQYSWFIRSMKSIENWLSLIIIYPVDINIALQFKGQSKCEVCLFPTTVLAARMHLLACAVRSHNTRVNKHLHWQRKILMACSTRAWASLNSTAGAWNVSTHDSAQKPLCKWCVSLLIIWGYSHIQQPVHYHPHPIPTSESPHLIHSLLPHSLSHKTLVDPGAPSATPQTKQNSVPSLSKWPSDQVGGKQV